ncbi:unnamed protein product [Didymodactylos carnosus]|uniref:Uncharacterized protein n=1 Tax=Didymodactylos carnosus TaxID=1234261 RepID=A0A814RPD3_9BILA|nr:unnamed protein product [Didymodactylos carnosus]CAF1135635.1 unnamed protein product [Didymodactylos carnosus]CAF3882550.1 unnamed protein product [Didymodactylos carnosus]CAF3899297.1 unnamed protein product [Didymodactylos carnosus]
MDSGRDRLRPYPIDRVQDIIVNKIVFAKKDLIPRITSFLFSIVKFPIIFICRRLNKTSIIQNVEEKNANEIIPISVCTPTDAMDSKYYYAVRDGKIWFKPIAAHLDAPWKLFGGNGFIDNTKKPLVSLSADGDNILAVDKNQVIHYAKSNEVVCEVSFDCPQWKIIQSRVKWTEKWFNMDGVSVIVNIFRNPVLKPVKNARSVAMSHKGHDTMYYTDMAGKKHPDPYVGVTTIYTLSEDGTRIYFADPWLRNKFENELTGPEDGQFIAETLAASASMVFLIQRARNENGKEIHKMYTRFGDFDSIGSNPALKATYNIKNRIPLIRIIPGEDWIEQPIIPLSKQARLTKNISVLQTGWGQNNRQLRVQGHNENGRSGYYYKNVYDIIWTFEITDHIIIAEEEFLSNSVPHTGFKQGPKVAKDYENGKLESNGVNIPMKITLEKFCKTGLNERGLNTKLVLRFENGFELSIPLYARRGWLSLLGISHKNIWKLVIPLEYYEEEDILVKQILYTVFHNKARHSVNVYEGKEEIRITNVYYSSCKFKFTFKNKYE